MIEDYLVKIEAILYLKTNQHLSVVEKSQKIKDTLSKFRDETFQQGYEKGVKVCQRAISTLDKNSYL